MKLNQPFKIKLRTLTPLHVGTGEELAPLDYVVLADQNRFYRLSQEEMLKFVTDQIDGGIGVFSNWVSEQITAMRDIRDNRAFSQMSNKMNPYEFCASMQKTKEFTRYLNDPSNSIFNAPVIVDNFTKQRHRGAKSISLGHIREAIKNHRKEPILPGSSIKGAIRTAVFYHYLKKHADPKRIESLLIHQLNNKRAKKERFALPLIHEAFFCRTRVGERLKKDDEKMDLFKLLRCKDAQLIKQEQVLGLAKVNIYLVEKKLSKDKTQSWMEATQQRQTSYCETIQAGTILESELDFDIEFLLQLKPNIKENAVPTKDGEQWIGIEQKVQQLFGIQLSELHAGNKEAMRQQVLKHLYECLSLFNQAQIKAYHKWLDHFDTHDKKDNYTEKIRTGSAPVFSRIDKQLMHLGYATGFAGMTALLFFLATDKRKILFKQLMARFGIGNKPGNRGNYIPNPDRFPKSRRLVEIGEKAIQPMGWVEVFPGDATIPVLEKADGSITIPTNQVDEAPAKPVEPEYFKGTINPRKPPELDAVIVAPGRPNRAKVYIQPDYTPEMDLTGYKNPMDKDRVIKVSTVFNKKKKLVQIAFKSFK